MDDKTIMCVYGLLRKVMLAFVQVVLSVLHSAVFWAINCSDCTFSKRHAGFQGIKLIFNETFIHVGPLGENSRSTYPTSSCTCHARKPPLPPRIFRISDLRAVLTVSFCHARWKRWWCGGVSRKLQV